MTEHWFGILRKPPASYVILAFGLWWIFVIISGQQILPVMKWDFAATGQLGDSFGVISALMTSLAAIFTYQTLSDTRDQARKAEAEAKRQKAAADDARFRAEAERLRLLNREKEQDRLQSTRAAEQTYFNLLNLRLSLLNDIEVKRSSGSKTGTDGIEHILDGIRYQIGYGNSQEDVYVQYSEKNSNDLNHYFRLTYHIIGFASENFSRNKSYELVRILRAQLSNAEIAMIALNCAYGGGKGEFKRRVEEYALLHNLRDEERAFFQLDDLFAPTAFERASSVSTTVKSRTSKAKS